MTNYDADLRQAFQEYVKSCTGSSKGSDVVDTAWASQTAISKIVLDCFPSMLRIHDAAVFPKCADRSRRKMHVDVFCSEWFQRLAQLTLQERERRRVDHRELAVSELATRLKAKVAARAQQPRKETAKTMSIVRRLTDHRLFTGVQKLRFDAEGRGRGLDGRGEPSAKNGYVQNYRGVGSFTYNRSSAPRQVTCQPRPLL